MVSGCVAQGIQARIPESHAQLERLGNGPVRETETHPDPVDERDRSRTGPATFSRWAEGRVHVGPVGNDGNLGERPRRKESHATERDRQRRNTALVTGRAVDRFRRTHEERNLHLHSYIERSSSEVAGGRHAREYLPELVARWAVGVLRIVAHRRVAGVE